MIDEIETEDENEYGYYRYLYHITNASYLRSICKEKDA